ncbi:uncharacterized protein LOC117639991 [Thrips palmi]|uniref:Uncharacterized protein LOC117639991 n=1 Tax=Thrips palmi TaxID=161013 RepID=A0A6P8XY43_THRPL|nr:uncharacterized protein LOC117639991 [Thrips palmi]
MRDMTDSTKGSGVTTQRNQVYKRGCRESSNNRTTPSVLQSLKMAGEILGGMIVVAGIVLNVCIWTSHGQVSAPPPCNVNGRIPPVTGNCSNQYYLCYNPNLNGNGNFSQWLYTCPGTSVFNEVTQRCSTACAVTTTTSTAAPAGGG